MSKFKILNTISLALAATALFWGIDSGRAHAEETISQSAITGNFRDPENVPKRRSTTNAQREEAARKAAEYRAEIARGASHTKKTPASNTTVRGTEAPPKTTGGTNE